jgi:hypothetical protein
VGICEVCHWQTTVFQNDGVPEAGTHPTARCTTCHYHAEGFKKGDCDSCHGFPPEPAGSVGTVPPDENYTGGGGTHLKHVQFLANKLSLTLNNKTDPKVVCGPCHGEGAGSTNHLNTTKGAGAWGDSTRQSVNIAVRTYSSWGTGPTYRGVALPTTGNNAAMDMTNSRCANLDCHGVNETNDAAVNVSWKLPADVEGPSGGNAVDAPERTKVCGACHDKTPANIRVYNAAGTLVWGSTLTGAAGYTSDAVNAAANYFGTLSGYSRGGHGDIAKIQTEDPFVNSDGNHDSSSPIDCTACHVSTAAHIPTVSPDWHRLGWTGTPTGQNLQDVCTNASCHSVNDYKQYHHPSFNGNDIVTHDVVPAAGQGVLNPVTNNVQWYDTGGGGLGPFEQRDSTTNTMERHGAGSSVSVATAIDPAGTIVYSKNADVFVDWWGTGGGSSYNASQQPPPRPVFYGESQSATPRAVLPLEQYVLGVGTSNRVLCTTCHNPHGTDLFMYDQYGVGQDVPDNNMLRLRNTDSTLCNACH